MSNLFETTDPRSQQVICTENTWNNHILRNRPWMVGWEEDIRRTIEEPSIGIYQDADFEDRNIYYRLHKGKDRYIKVVVAFDENGLGEVITAFSTDTPKSGEKLIWPELTP